jgi:transcriptional regulator with XRE-family HTH domain
MTKRSKSPPDYALLMVPELLRAARRWKGLSQRELAARSGLPKTTIGRLESGETSDPSVSTLQRVLAGAGFGLIVVDEDGDELTYFNAPGGQRDAAGRHLPAHLERRRLDRHWWGWYRIAWERTNHPRPEWIYEKRPAVRPNRRYG